MHSLLPAGAAGVTITTYTMIAFNGKRSEESERVMQDIMSREWGLILLDEVHVVPAQVFRKVRRPAAFFVRTGYSACWTDHNLRSQAAVV